MKRLPLCFYFFSLSTLITASVARADSDTAPILPGQSTIETLFTLSIQDDPDTKTHDPYEIKVSVDSSGQLVGIIVIPPTKPSKPGAQAVAPLPVPHSLAEIASDNGTVLARDDEHNLDLIKITGSVNPNTQMGSFTLSYLTDGGNPFEKNKPYKTCELLVQRDSQGAWYAKSAFSQNPLTTSIIHTWRNIFGTPVGIKKIDGISSAD